MQVDVILVGQGLSGTFLSWCLQKEGKTFLVIDQPEPNTASRVAGGLINPVTGRRYSQSWMIETLMSEAKRLYTEMGDFLEVSLLHPKTVIDFFPTPQMRNTFLERLTENDTYPSTYPDQNSFNPQFNYEFGCGEIKPAYVAQVGELLHRWRQHLSANKQLVEGGFRVGDLTVNDGEVRYENIVAQKIIFCDGAAGSDNPFFALLPFAPNKGEALILECEGLPRDHVFKRNLLLVPLGTEKLFWFGGGYKWEYDNAGPTKEFLDSATAMLKTWIKHPFNVLEHRAAVRPATVERRPFVGFHPQHPQVGILNGMGTKGASLAPYFANQLTQHLVHGTPLVPEADVRRFSRVLSKTDPLG